MEVILSTRNPSKVKQIKAIFEGSPITILTLDDAKIEGQGIEDGITLEQNTFKKALFVHQAKPDMWVMADDTGIFINALNGRPGVDTANWTGGNKETEQITWWILQQLKDVKYRSATFKTVVAVISPEGERFFFTGQVQGKILQTPKTKPQPKMPYSSIFQPDKSDKVWAEMTVKEENEISHRGIAFKKALGFFKSLQESIE